MRERMSKGREAVMGEPAPLSASSCPLFTRHTHFFASPNPFFNLNARRITCWLSPCFLVTLTHLVSFPPFLFMQKVKVGIHQNYQSYPSLPLYYMWSQLTLVLDLTPFYLYDLGSASPGATCEQDPHLQLEGRWLPWWQCNKSQCMIPLRITEPYITGAVTQHITW